MRYTDILPILFVSYLSATTASTTTGTCIPKLCDTRKTEDPGTVFLILSPLLGVSAVVASAYLFNRFILRKP